ncbi:MAG: IS110 family transposase [Actinobacteria bacterium]|nr:IS110 family transposase [Actinomycetota bacterium]
MVVGIDVHKRSHAAALLDGNGVVLAALTIPNSLVGVERLLGWLNEHDAREAAIGIENAAGYGRLLCAALAAAGCEILNVPAWRTHRDRHEQGRGKSDPGDAVAIAHVVLRKREQLGPALEPELIRALALLEGLRRQSVYDRTQAIQRLRAIWTQVDPEGEARVIHCQRQRELRKLTRIAFGAGIAEQAAARCIRELAREIERLNDRIAALEHELEQLLRECGNPFADLAGAGATVAVALIAHSGDVRRFKDKGAYARFCGVAPIRCGSGRTADHHRLDRGGNRQLNAALHRIAVVQARVDPRAQAFLARKRAEGKTAREARRALKRHLANVVYRRLHAWAEIALPA